MNKRQRKKKAGPGYWVRGINADHQAGPEWIWVRAYAHSFGTTAAARWSSADNCYVAFELEIEGNRLVERGPYAHGDSRVAALRELYRRREALAQLELN